MKKITFALFVFFCAGQHTFAQLPKSAPLYLELKKQDSIFFERSFNLCDSNYLKAAIHPDLIFFHDQGGIQNREQFLEAVKNNICGNPNFKPIRKPKEGSLEVFPLYSNGKLYGAVQHGVHYFYIREPGKKDRLTNIARFTHVWLLQDGKWLLKEVLSYDHQEPAAAKNRKMIR